MLEILGKLGFDWKMALANFVNFMLIFWILRRYVFAKVRAVLEDRKAKIEKGLDDAAEAERDRAFAKEEYKLVLKKAEEKSHDILQKTEKMKDDILEESRVKAKEDAERILLSADQKLKDDRERMERELKEASADMIVVGVENMLKAKITQDSNNSFISKAI